MLDILKIYQEITIDFIFCARNFKLPVLSIEQVRVISGKFENFKKKLEKIYFNE